MQRRANAKQKWKEKSSLSTSFFWVLFFCTISEIEVFMIDTGMSGETSFVTENRGTVCVSKERKEYFSFTLFFFYLCVLYISSNPPLFPFTISSHLLLHFVLVFGAEYKTIRSSVWNYIFLLFLDKERDQNEKAFLVCPHQQTTITAFCYWHIQTLMFLVWSYRTSGWTVVDKRVSMYK